jgi:hypothetical protein
MIVLIALAILGGTASRAKYCILNFNNFIYSIVSVWSYG